MRYEIRTVTRLKSAAAELLDQIEKDRRPVVIVQKGIPRAILLDPESFERMRMAIGMLRLLAEGERDVRAGRTEEQGALFRRLKKRLAARTNRERS